MTRKGARVPYVVKVGGSVLATPRDICHAIESINDSLGLPAVIVVSAMKGETDRLFSTALGAGITSPDAVDSIVAQGEVTTCRILGAALEHRGIDTIVLTPCNGEWPIITDDRFGDATPILDRTDAALDMVREALDKGTTVVMAGFLGMTANGRITTLGRGGSDLSAILVGRLLGLRVVLAKDVDGCYPDDPKGKGRNARFSTMSTEDLLALAKDGAPIVQRKALDFIDEGMQVSVTCLDDLRGGTVVETKACTTLDEVPPSGQSELARLRERLRGVDLAMASLLGERFHVARDIYEIKQRYGLSLRVPDQEIKNTENFTEACARLGLPRELGTSLIRTIIDESLRIQRVLQLRGREDQSN